MYTRIVAYLCNFRDNKSYFTAYYLLYQKDQLLKIKRQLILFYSLMFSNYVIRVPSVPLIGWGHRVWHGHPLDLKDQRGVP